ncbi:hypothetical protein BH11ARM1_BH11ARM1_15350 [soil metagenome]
MRISGLAKVADTSFLPDQAFRGKGHDQSQENIMKKLALALVACLSIGGGALALAQSGNHTQHQAGLVATQKSPKMEMCKQMMADKVKMKAHMKDMEAKLDDLVSQMDTFTGEAKSQAIAAAVKELVSQGKVMRAMKEEMETKMMSHMMQHMQSGKMTPCPMMKGM